MLTTVLVGDLVTTRTDLVGSEVSFLMEIALSGSKLGWTEDVMGSLEARAGGLLSDTGITDDADCMRCEAEADGNLY